MILRVFWWWFRGFSEAPPSVVGPIEPPPDPLGGDEFLDLSAGGEEPDYLIVGGHGDDDDFLVVGGV